MNNNGAIYIAASDHHLVMQTLQHLLREAGFQQLTLPPDRLSGQLMPINKTHRHFFVVPAVNDWVTIWEDPRYFADRTLAQGLAQHLNCRAIWVEAGGNTVSWAYAIYEGPIMLRAQYEETWTTYYGEYGPLTFVFNPSESPEDFAAHWRLPFPLLYYRALLDANPPAEVPPPLHYVCARGSVVPA